MIDETGHLRGLGAGRVALAELHSTLGSTNERARELARAGCPAWTVVRALMQTGGRGRSGREWSSPKGGLYLSVVLRPKFSEVTLLPLAAGLAVREALSGFGVDARLKWPNDVLIGSRKIAGLLAEGTSSARGFEWVVLGVGVNIRTPDASVAEVATSLADQGTGPVPRADAVAARMIGALVGWYDRLEQNGSRDIVTAWSAASFDWSGQLVEGLVGNEVVRGLGRGIDECGALLLEQPDGSVRRLLSGDVRRVRTREGEGDPCY